MITIRRVRHPGGFYLPNPPREKIFHTDTGKANLTSTPSPSIRWSRGQLVMMTVRSHDQFNTTIYGQHDRYRGSTSERRVVMMNREDMEEQGLQPQQLAMSTQAISKEHDSPWFLVVDRDPTGVRGDVLPGGERAGPYRQHRAASANLPHIQAHHHQSATDHGGRD